MWVGPINQLKGLQSKAGTCPKREASCAHQPQPFRFQTCFAIPHYTVQLLVVNQWVAVSAIRQIKRWTTENPCILAPPFPLQLRLYGPPVTCCWGKSLVYIFVVLPLHSHKEDQIHSAGSHSANRFLLTLYSGITVAAEDKPLSLWLEKHFFYFYIFYFAFLFYLTYE